MLYTQFDISIKIPLEKLDLIELRKLVDDYGFVLFTVNDIGVTVSCVLETKSCTEFKLKTSQLESALCKTYGEYNAGCISILKNWTTDIDITEE